MQLMNCNDPHLSEDAYFNVIYCKTAKLFEAATRLPAVLAGSDARTELALQEYGRYLGTAFQIIDDVMDYTADSDVMGKSVGDDLAEGKATLPLIHAMRTANDSDRALLSRAITERDGIDYLERILEILHQTGAFDYSQRKAEAEAEKAKQALSCLPDSQYRSALLALADLAVHRNT